MSTRGHSSFDLYRIMSTRKAVQPESICPEDQSEEGVLRDNMIFFGDHSSSNNSESSSLPPKTPQPPLSPSSSSSEEIIFTGRSAHGSKTIRNPTATGSIPMEKSSRHVKHDPKRIKSQERFTIDVVHDSITKRQLPRHLPGQTLPIAFSPLSPTDVQEMSLRRGSMKRKSRVSLRTQTRQVQKSRELAQWQSQEDAIRLDYITNIIENESIAYLENEQDAKNPRIEVPLHDLADGPKIKIEDSALLPGLVGEGFDDVLDLHSQNTSSEEDFVADRLLSKRQGHPGMQCLNLEEDRELNRASGLSSSYVSAFNAVEVISNAEHEQEQANHDICSSSGSDNPWLTSNVQPNPDDFQENTTGVGRRQALQTKVQAARSQPQKEEINQCSSELLIPGGSEDEYEQSMAYDHSGFFEHYAPIRSSTRCRSKKYQSDNEFLSPSFFAGVLEEESYGYFDIMDRERPSLQNKHKKRRSATIPELSDSELEISFGQAWEKDRTKKKLRKQQREALREQGHLGRKSKLDLRAKNGNNVKMSLVKDQIKEFMASTSHCLNLPPMAHRDRKTVHETANRLGLKSRSSGAGHGRYPVLYKTGKTGKLDSIALNKIEASFGPRQSGLRNGRASQKSVIPTGHNRGGGASAGVSYRDGEVVGAAAPEIGHGNKGRAMLEKMGWSDGTALGASNNKGMLQPVSHTVKTTKAGLG